MNTHNIDYVDYLTKLSPKERAWFMNFQRKWSDERREARVKDISYVGVPVGTKMLGWLLSTSNDLPAGFLEFLGVFNTSRTVERYYDRINKPSSTNYTTEEYAQRARFFVGDFSAVDSYLDSQKQQEFFLESEVPGVTQDPDTLKWKAVRRWNEKTYKLGTFEHIKDAEQAVAKFNKTVTRSGYGVDY